MTVEEREDLQSWPGEQEEREEQELAEADEVADFLRTYELMRNRSLQLDVVATNAFFHGRTFVLAYAKAIEETKREAA